LTLTFSKGGEKKHVPYISQTLIFFNMGTQKEAGSRANRRMTWTYMAKNFLWTLSGKTFPDDPSLAI
jgi:hypothetical protein